MKRKAFTLIELIIVIVVLGILATIAIVGYRAVIDRANLSSAENAAKSFDRQIRAQAAFGMDGNPNMTDPRRGQLMIDMLTDANSSGAAAISKDLPDADDASLSTNQLRVLVWNHEIGAATLANWTRLCNASACGTLATGSTAGKVPVGSTANAAGAEICIAFRKGGQTAYLGLSDRSNTPGTVSSDQAVACSATTVTPLVVTSSATSYSLPNGTAVTDATWG